MLSPPHQTFSTCLQTQVHTSQPEPTIPYFDKNSLLQLGLAAEF